MDSFMGFLTSLLARIALLMPQSAKKAPVVRRIYDIDITHRYAEAYRPDEVTIALGEFQRVSADAEKAAKQALMVAGNHDASLDELTEARESLANARDAIRNLEGLHLKRLPRYPVDLKSRYYEIDSELNSLEKAVAEIESAHGEKDETMRAKSQENREFVIKRMNDWRGAIVNVLKDIERARAARRDSQ